MLSNHEYRIMFFNPLFRFIFDYHFFLLCSICSFFRMTIYYIFISSFVWKNDCSLWSWLIILDFSLKCNLSVLFLKCSINCANHILIPGFQNETFQRFCQENWFRLVSWKYSLLFSLLFLVSFYFQYNAMDQYQESIINRTYYDTLNLFDILN